MSDNHNKPALTPDQSKAYWSATVRLTVSLLSIWFAVSVGAGILLHDTLDQICPGGPLIGIWHAQHGAYKINLALYVYYTNAMNKDEHHMGFDV